MIACAKAFTGRRKGCAGGINSPFGLATGEYRTMGLPVMVREREPCMVSQCRATISSTLSSIRPNASSMSVRMRSASSGRSTLAPSGFRRAAAARQPPSRHGLHEQVDDHEQVLCG